MIRSTALTLRRGTKVLLDNTTFVVHPGERLGIVGKNGAGKSSLFSLILGEIDQDAGTIDIPPTWRIAHVKQHTLIGKQSAREFVIDGDTHLRHVQQQRAAADLNNGHLIAELEHELIEAGHWTAKSRAEQLLAGLGFTPAQWVQAIERFSGGWQVRLALARALMMPSDLLLLDEPTNHLDLDAMLWLEKWLQHYAGTVILISHDTEFLNAVAKSILHIDAQTLVRYTGNYDHFLTQRAERIRQQQLSIDKQTRETQRLQRFIDRFKAKATKAKQAQSRVKALARMQLLSPIRAESSIDIHLPSPLHTPDPLMVLDKVSVGYQHSDHSNHAVLSDITLMVRGGARIGVLGANGAGKTTLIKTIAQELKPLSGQFTPSKGLSIGYFAQQQLDMLDMQASPLMHLQRLADPGIREQQLRNYLGMFGFSGDVVTQAITPFSGGEKARLALSLIVWQKPNVLLLDEPSNHLDTDTREALATALAEFDGGVLMVSHDRHLLRNTVDSFWIVANGRVIEFDGDLEDYQAWLTNQPPQQQRKEDKEYRPSMDRKAQKRQEAEKRQEKAGLRKPLEKKAALLEQQLKQNQLRLASIDLLIAEESFYSEERRDERLALLEEHGILSRDTLNLEEQWFSILEQLEAIEG